MKVFSFRLRPFLYDDLTQEELNLRFRACAEDARRVFETADVNLVGSILSISVSDQDELSLKVCKEEFKKIIQQDSISLGAEPLCV